MKWRKIFQNYIFSIYGGLVGAVFGLYAMGIHTGKQVWFLIIIYGIFAFVILWALNFRKNKDHREGLKK